MKYTISTRTLCGGHRAEAFKEGNDTPMHPDATRTVPWTDNYRNGYRHSLKEDLGKIEGEFKALITLLLHLTADGEMDEIEAKQHVDSFFEKHVFEIPDQLPVVSKDVERANVELTNENEA